MRTPHCPAWRGDCVRALCPLCIRSVSGLKALCPCRGSGPELRNRVDRRAGTKAAKNGGPGQTPRRSGPRYWSASATHQVLSAYALALPVAHSGAFSSHGCAAEQPLAPFCSGAQRTAASVAGALGWQKRCGGVDGKDRTGGMERWEWRGGKDTCMAVVSNCYCSRSLPAAG